jgi:inorganic pyrophosphatase
MHYGNTEIFLTAHQREQLILSLLGKKAVVVIDRPIGYTHVTKGITLHYSVNYGYLPGVMGGDGEEQDVYVLGVKEPLKEFEGTIIGAIRRVDDNEDKLVAAPAGMIFTAQEIEEAVWFVERYFESSVESIFDRESLL